VIEHRVGMLDEIEPKSAFRHEEGAHVRMRPQRGLDFGPLVAGGVIEDQARLAVTSGATGRSNDGK
jgi:hypothetical protein